jgi:hypothetical protein
LNVTVGKVLVATPVAPSAGVEPVASGPLVVVNVHVTGAASGEPFESLTVVSSFAVYVVPFVSADAGVSLAVFVAESYATVAATGLPPFGVSVKLDVVIVVAFIALENVAVGFTKVLTSVAAFAGVVAVTVGPDAWIVQE